MNHLDGRGGIGAGAAAGATERAVHQADQQRPHHLAGAIDHQPRGGAAGPGNVGGGVLDAAPHHRDLFRQQ